MRVTLVALMALIAACAAPDGSGRDPGADLTGVTWALESLGNNPALDSTSARPAFLTFNDDDSTLGGSGGCNSMSGSYETSQDGVTLTIDPGAMTLMACAQPAMDQEQAFLTMLEAVDSYRLEGGALLLLKGDEVLARFRVATSP